MTKARDLSKLLSTANGKIAGNNLDVSFENISDTGTEGTKVASGTTAQRGSTTGQWRYNTTTGFFEGRGASDFNSLAPTPTITSSDISEVDSTAGGNQTVVITGTNFSSGGTVAFVGSSATFNASTTTFNSATQVTAVAPKSSFLNAQEPYTIKFTSSSGNAGSSASGLINVDSAPTWTTNAGSLGSIAENATGNHFTVAASDAESDTIAYTLQSGSLAGLSLNSSTGVISGDPTDVNSATTNNFTIRATAGGKTSDRAFSYITTNVPIVQAFSYTGSNQNFTVPSGITSFQVFMWGAGGGGGNSGSSGYVGGNGGAGGYVTSTISNYSAGQTFSLLVGGATSYSSNSQAIANYGGGGSGTDNNGGQSPGGNGGGRSEISIGGGANTPAGTRILVAGAGGGGAGSYHTGESNGDRSGGNAGHPTGQRANGSGTNATGGTQSAGGTKGSGNSNTAWSNQAPADGSAGIGGYGRSGTLNEDIGYGRPGGGGGGYYGGGGGDAGVAGAVTPQGGGGGSSYANSSYASNVTYVAGNETSAPETSNTHYASGIAKGGTGDNNGSRNQAALGGNGRIVLVY